jgi:hypothetical protein
MKILRNLFGPKRNSEHHYAFAHVALRRIAFAEPIRIFGILASPDRERFIDGVLADIHEQCQISTRCSFRGRDVEFSGAKINDRPCAILKMPTPTEPVEAHFIALVSRLGVDEFTAEDVESRQGELLDYYTFERPVVVEGGRPTVFCSWSEDDSHSNYGEGPEADLQSVVEFLTATLAGPSANS